MTEPLKTTESRANAVFSVRYVDGPWEGHINPAVHVGTTEIWVPDYTRPVAQPAPAKGQKAPDPVYRNKGVYLITGNEAYFKEL